MDCALKIAGYARISFDEDKSMYTSIINQQEIISEYAKRVFGVDEVQMYEDDNYSGYSFDRPSFTRLKQEMERGNIDILIAKDLSRIGRHNARTLLFLEEVQLMGKRVIAINDNLDTDKSDSDSMTGIKTWFNELYVKDTSRKIRAVIDSKQRNAAWISNVPFGYRLIDARKVEFEVDEMAADIVKRIFKMYLSGMGYKKIAEELTADMVPTPRMFQKKYADEEGKPYRKAINPVWSVPSVQGILKNDFYIGTLRTKKYTRNGINGKDQRIEKSEQNVFPNNHIAILDEIVFQRAQEANAKRESTYYRGTQKHPNVYTGFLTCGDCGGPMYSISQPKEKRHPAYICSSYHKHGPKACSSHHILVSTMDAVLKSYLERIKDNAAHVLATLDKEVQDIARKDAKAATENQLASELATVENELKALAMQRVRQTIKYPERAEEIDKMYDELEEEYRYRIDGMAKQLDFIKKRRAGSKENLKLVQTAMDIFDRIIEKESLDKEDLEMILDKAIIYENRVEVFLKSDLENILALDSSESGENEQNTQLLYTQQTPKARAKTLSTNVICCSDPLEIFTDRDGEVILKKYSPIGEISDFAKEYTDSIAKTLGHTALISDRDSYIAASGTGKKDYQDKAVSAELEEIMEKRTPFIANRKQGSAPITLTDIETDNSEYVAQVVVPVIVEGDASGAVVLLTRQPDADFGDTELKVAQAAAGFLGRQMEQ